MQERRKRKVGKMAAQEKYKEANKAVRKNFREDKIDEEEIYRRPSSGR